MEKILSRLLIFIVMASVDYYIFWKVKKLSEHLIQWKSRAIHFLYWFISIISIFFAVSMGSTKGRFHSPDIYRFAFWGVGFIFLFALPKVVFLIFALVNDLVLFVRKIKAKSLPEEMVGQPMKRKEFITKVGLATAGIPFISLSYGIVQGRFDFRLVEQTVPVKNLPKGLNGMRILQVSDFHLGSFFENYKAVQDGFNMANDQKCDIVFFTGDLVNNYASEVSGFEKMLDSLDAPLGKYSILGNHDYGDYSLWDNDEMKRKNFNDIVKAHEKTGFRLLRNENMVIKQGGEEFSLIGVENWGKPPFKQYGDLKKAMDGADPSLFQLLLTHDPTHWEKEVMTKIPIDLTLSGHTHGMQFGIEVGNIKWSLARLKYKRWGGLYEETDQFLYVNRGFGYIGFPGRVGIPPEITVLELKRI